MHALKTGFNAPRFANFFDFLDVSEKVLSLIRFANDPYTL